MLKSLTSLICAFFLWTAAIQNIFAWGKSLPSTSLSNVVFSSAVADEGIVLKDLENSKSKVGNEGFSNEAWEIYIIHVLNMALAFWYAMAGSRCSIPGLKCNWLMIVTAATGMIHIVGEFVLWIMMYFVKADYENQLAKLKSKSGKKGLEVEAFNKCASVEEDEEKVKCLEEAGVEEGQGSVQLEVLKKLIELYEDQKFALELKRYFLIAVEAMNVLITIMEYVDAAGENMKDSAVITSTPGLGKFCALQAAASAKTPAGAICSPLDAACAKALKAITAAEIAYIGSTQAPVPTKVKCGLAKKVEMKKVMKVLAGCAAACCSQVSGFAAITLTLDTAQRRTCEGLAEAQSKLEEAKNQKDKYDLVKRGSKYFNYSQKLQLGAGFAGGAGVAGSVGKLGLTLFDDEAVKLSENITLAKSKLASVKCSYPCQLKAPPIVFRSLPQKKKWYSSFIDIGKNLLLPKSIRAGSVADFLEEELRVVVVSLLVIVTIVFLAIDVTADSWFYTPLQRGIFSTVATVIVGFQIAQNESAHTTVVDNIAKLKQLFKEIEASISVPTGLNNNGEKLFLDDNVGRDFEQEFLQDFKNTQLDKELPCIGGEAPDGKGGCLSTSKGIGDAFAKIGLEDIAGIRSDLVKVGDELSGRRNVNAEVLSGLGSIGEKRQALKKLLEKAKLDLNRTRENLGLDDIDTDAAAKGLLDTLKANTLQTLKDNSIGLSELSSAFGGGLPGGTSKKLSDKQKENLKKIKTAANKELDIKPEDKDTGFSFQFDKQNDPNAGITDDSINSLRENTDKYKIDKGDISKRSKDDIFRMITTRYFKTALPVLLEEVK